MIEICAYGLEKIRIKFENQALTRQFSGDFTCPVDLCVKHVRFFTFTIHAMRGA